MVLHITMTSYLAMASEKYQPHGCLLNRLFRSRSKKTSKLHVTGLCAGNSPVTGEFTAQRASNAEKVSIRWRHHDWTKFPLNSIYHGKIVWWNGSWVNANISETFGLWEANVLTIFVSFWLYGVIGMAKKHLKWHFYQRAILLRSRLMCMALLVYVHLFGNS